MEAIIQAIAASGLEHMVEDEELEEAFPRGTQLLRGYRGVKRNAKYIAGAGSALGAVSGLRTAAKRQRRMDVADAIRKIAVGQQGVRYRGKQYGGGRRYSRFRRTAKRKGGYRSRYRYGGRRYYGRYRSSYRRRRRRRY